MSETPKQTWSFVFTWDTNGGVTYEKQCDCLYFPEAETFNQVNFRELQSVIWDILEKHEKDLCVSCGGAMIKSEYSNID